MDDMKIAYRTSDTNQVTSDYPNYTLLLAAIKSKQTPRQIVIFAKKIGMIIPVRYRFGILAYRYFIYNFLDYSQVIYFQPIFKKHPQTKLYLYSDEILNYFLPKEKKYLWNSRKELELIYMEEVRRYSIYSVDLYERIYIYYPEERYLTVDNIIDECDMDGDNIRIGNQKVCIPKNLEQRLKLEKQIEGMSDQQKKLHRKCFHLHNRYLKS